MDRNIEGAKLALMLLIPCLIIGAAVIIGLKGLDRGNNEVALVSEDTTAEASPTATPIPTATPAETPTAIVVPTAIEGTPTPVVLATPLASPVATAIPTTAPATPKPAAPTRPSGGSTAPAATATPDPNKVVVSCGLVGGGAIPTTAKKGTTIGQLEAIVTPAEAKNTMTFSWNYGNGQGANASRTPNITYAKDGTYKIVLTATPKAGGPAIVTTCATVKVGAATSSNTDIKFTCTVRPVDKAVKWIDAEPGTRMRVTATWTPKTTPLTVVFDVSPLKALTQFDGVTSGKSIIHQFTASDYAATVTWRNLETKESGRVSCPVYDPKGPYSTGGYDTATTP